MVAMSANKSRQNNGLISEGSSHPNRTFHMTVDIGLDKIAEPPDGLILEGPSDHLYKTFHHQKNM